jgi:two-component system sensor histidine kinase FlrB
MQILPKTRQKRSASSRAKRATKRLPQRSLAEAFRSFTDAAGSLETSYSLLQAEIARLRCDLEQTNKDLTLSLDENKRIRSYLGHILEGLPCGVVVVDAEGRLRMANPAAHRLLGVEPQSANAPSGLSPEAISRLCEALPIGDCMGEQEWTVEGADGRRFVAVSRAGLPASGDSSRDWIFILRDITEEKKLAQDREARRHTQALAEIAMLLAHEIRNPLGSLELFAGLLADATENQPATHQWVIHMQAGLRTLSATVNNVLQFHSQPRTELATVNVVRLLNETIDFLRPLARQKSMHIAFSAVQPEILLPADPHRLQQVFFNLALNAFRAMAPAGELQVRVGWSEDSPDRVLRIDFEDHGVGIASENLERIFDVGYTTQAGSPGLGLAVSKKVVEQHGGTIQVRSALGEGSTFSLIFPIPGAA